VRRRSFPNERLEGGRRRAITILCAHEAGDLLALNRDANNGSFKTLFLFQHGVFNLGWKQGCSACLPEDRYKIGSSVRGAPIARRILSGHLTAVIDADSNADTQSKCARGL
jgi:hypothetical protein